MAWASEKVFSGNSSFKLVLTINPDGQSVSGNWTDVDFSLQIVKTSYSPSWSNNTSHYSVSVGQSVGNSQNWQGNFTYDFRNSDQKWLKTGTKRVYHNANGQSSVYAGANCTASNLGTAAVSDINQTLPTIARKSVPTVSPTSVDAGSSVTISTHRADASFTHTITYKFGSATGTIATKTTNADPTWTPPLSLLSEIPNSTSGTCTITVTTYDGNTSLGSNNVNLTIKAPSSVVPTFTSVTAVEGVSAVTAAGLANPVQGVSKLNVGINGAAGAYGSTITNYVITAGDSTVNAASGQTETIQNSGTLTVTGKITDSRGRTATKSINLTILAYTPPTLNAVTFQRALATGVPDSQGTYIRANINASVSSLKNGATEKNKLSYKIYTRDRAVGGAFALKKTANPAGLTFNSYDIVSPYDVEKSWDVLLEVSDLFATSSQQGTVATAAIFMHWGGKGQGVGVGKYWERGSVDAKGQIYQNDGKKVVDETSGDARYYTQGSANNTFLSKADAASYNVLWTGAMYMAADQSITLAQPVSAQRLGIVLIWGAYSGGAVQNWDYTQTFVPKYMVSAFPGVGTDCLMASGGTLVRKYIYINDASISGNANNDVSPQNLRVLRAVIGI